MQADHKTEYAAQRRLIQTLAKSMGNRAASTPVRLLETHISWILLFGRHAYKIKKAVNLGFLDFSSLQARRFYCEEEIRLNRRLAPKIYLDVIAIGGNAENPVLGEYPASEADFPFGTPDAVRKDDMIFATGLVLDKRYVGRTRANTTRIFSGSVYTAAIQIGSLWVAQAQHFFQYFFYFCGIFH